MAAKSELDVLVNGKDNLSPTLDQIQSKIIRFVGFVSSALTAINIASFPVDQFRNFERAMADVQKTTNFSNDQIKELGDNLINLSRRIDVSAVDLAKIAAAAGQQGLGREGVAGIEQFTESVSRMASVLDITVEQAGTDIGKIASIFKVPMNQLENAVSAFNQVSNNSTASGEQLLDVVKRIGDAAGSLNLAQSIGVSATGIDLGLSPEVVGTSFSKVFSEMYAQADQFAKLLNTDVTTWMGMLQKDGVGALKAYLAALRTMSADEQQKWIKQLSGGGRIGVLVTKLLRDSEDTILDRNLAQSQDGINKGTSAIKEQLNVLQTLDAQIKMAQNSFNALGEKAGEVFGKRLASYFAQLNSALANPAVIEFAQAVGGAMLDMLDVVVKLIKEVASWNIQWQNLITFAKIWVGLKLVQSFAGMLANATGLSGAWKTLGLSAAEAAAAQEKAASAGSGAFAGSITRMKELIAQQQAKTAAVLEEVAAQEALKKKQQELQAASVNKFNTGAAVAQAQNALANSPQAAAVSNARDGVSAAQSSAAAANTAAQQALNTRLERAEQEHNTRMAAIEQQRLEASTAARAAGSRAALLAATKDYKDQTAAEDAYYARSLRSINAYHATRIANIQTAGAAEVAAAQATFAASLSAFDGAVNAKGLANLQSTANSAAAAVSVLSAEATVAAERLTLAQRASLAAAAGVNVFKTAVGLAGAALRAFGTIASKALFWLTVIYTAAEALGITDTIAKYFQKFTDAIGLTSQASRDAAKQQQDVADKLAATRQALQDGAKEMDKYTDATGRLSDKTQEMLKQLYGAQDKDTYLKTFQEALSMLDAAEKKAETLKKAQETANSNVPELQNQRDTAADRISSLQADLARAKQVQSAAGSYGDDGTSQMLADQQVASIQAEIDQQQKLFDKANSNLEKYGTNAVDTLGKGFAAASANIADIQKVITDSFTTISANVFDQYFPQLQQQLQVQEDAKKALDDATKAYAEVSGASVDQDTKDAAKSVYEQALAQYEVANQNIANVKQQVIKAIEDLKATGGLTEATVGSLDALKSYMDLSLKSIGQLVTAEKSARAAGATFAGSAAQPPSTNTTGNQQVDRTTESELRRRRANELAIAKAGLQAEADLQKEYNSQAEDENERLYKKGLKSIKDYYAERLRIQRANLSEEIKLRQAELGEVQNNIAAAAPKKKAQTDTKPLANETDPAPATPNTQATSEQLGLQTQAIRLQGQIAVMQAQYKALTQQNDEAQQDALDEFRKKIASQKEALIEYLGGGPEEAYKATLEAAKADSEDFINQLKSEAKDRPELTPIINAIELKQKIDATTAALDEITKSSQRAQDKLQLVADKINALGEAGVLTATQVSALTERNNEVLADTMEKEVQQKQAQLNSLKSLVSPTQEQIGLIQDLQASIDSTTSQMEILRLKGNSVATEINNAFKDDISSALQSLYKDGASFGDAVSTFVTSIFETLADKATDQIADTIMQSLNSALTAAGQKQGIGGFWSTLMGGSSESLDGTSVADKIGQTSSDSGKALGLLGTAGQTLGASPATPLYVTDAASAIGGIGAATDSSGLGLGAATNLPGVVGGGTGTSATPDEGFFSKAFDSVTSTFSDVGSTLSSGLTGLGGTLGGVFSGVGNSLLSFLGTMLSAITTAIASASAADATSSGIAGLGSAAGSAAAAHNGGIIGKTTMRRSGISPAAFRDAVRYHTGGKVGLAPNEVPAILEKGEEVLTANDPRHTDNLGSGTGGSASGGASQNNFTVMPVMSEDAVADALKGSKGQKLLLVHITKNPAKFRSALGITK